MELKPRDENELTPIEQPHFGIPGHSFSYSKFSKEGKGRKANYVPTYFRERNERIFFN